MLLVLLAGAEAASRPGSVVLFPAESLFLSRPRLQVFPARNRPRADADFARRPEKSVFARRGQNSEGRVDQLREEHRQGQDHRL